MNEQELKETLVLLENAGKHPLLCDMPVRLSAGTVKCGNPTELGDEDYSEYMMIPKSIVGMYPEIFITAEGDSMRDAGFETGDQLRVRLGADARDGDIVLAWIDGQCTVKSLFTDEDGQQWLVPQNDAYDAILLKEEMNAKILGIIVGVEKSSPRASSRTLLQAIRKTKNKWKAARKLSEEEVNNLIVRISVSVVHARQWFAVYKAMAEREVIANGSYQEFCSRVRTLLPQHQHLPDAYELSRMDVLSFSKPIVLWEESDAPVRGSRFRDYRSIALAMLDYLSA